MIRILTHRAPAVLVAVVAIVGAVVVGAVVRVVTRLQVEGASMLPTLQPGDRLVVLPLSPAAGQLVVVRDPREPARLMVKRCTARLPDGSVTVAGDNPGHSTDSRHFGQVPGRLVVGRPVHRYLPEDRAGALWRS